MSQPSGISRTHHQQQQGFSLLELLVALTLVGIVFFAMTPSEQSSRNQMLNAIEKLEMLILKGQTEALLRGSICRIKFVLEASKQHYQLECANESDFTLLPFDEVVAEAIKREKREKLDKNPNASTQGDKSFTPIKTEEGDQETLTDHVKILGVGLESLDKVIIDGEVSIHFFSDGEKEPAIVFFANDYEVMGAAIAPYHNQTTITNEPVPLKELNTEETFKMWEEIAADMFLSWKKT